MNQKPGLYITYSEGKGRGVFTSQAIEEGEVIEICPVLIIPQEELPVIHKTVLHDYYFLWGNDLNECAIALGFGSIYNHELHPNANFILDIQNQTIDIEAIKSIEPGEEITLNYHGEPGNTDKLWF
ncbi:MAG: SET domain-containing protein [Saprospiraceae bacterium]|nr:SET domain-containing protein [Saprospiraceae bacterium]